MSEASPPVVFLGPTMDHYAAAALAQANFCPPAAMGDITQATARRASAIILIDGVFECGPSVWHKEILYALSRGIPVVGASSMGALRAAELHTLGMLGVGKVFDDYASGALVDDDEVAVVHGPAETGWLPLSDAMVDIRVGVERAVSSGVMDTEDAAQLIQHAKATYFKSRSLHDSLKAVVTDKNRQALISNWFHENTASQKGADCLNVLENLPDVLERAQEHLLLAPEFVPTIYMKRLKEFGYQSPRGD
jgi:hypothetical protein